LKQPKIYKLYGEILMTTDKKKHIFYMFIALFLCFSCTFSAFSVTNSEQTKISLNVLKENISKFESDLKQYAGDIKLRSDLADAYLVIGNIYFNEASYEKAANDYRKGIFYILYDENLPKMQIAPEILTELTENLNRILTIQKSSSYASRIKIAKQLRGEGNFIEATVEFNAVLPDKKSNVEALTALGDIMRVIQKDIKAVEYYEKALAINPAEATLHLKIARALARLGNIDDAVREYNLALNFDDKDTDIVAELENLWRTKIKENPQDANAHMNLGVVLQKKGDFNGAGSEYNIAQNIDPSNVTLRLNLGTLLQAQGDLPSAIRAYDTILEVEPTNVLAHYYRAKALRQVGNIQGAADEFSIVLKIDPSNVQARKDLYDTLKQSVNPQERLGVFENFAKNNPEDAIAQYNYAWELQSSKKYQEAVKYYQKAIALDPNIPDFYISLSTLFKDVNQNYEAKTTLENALALLPDNKKIKDELENLTETEKVFLYKDAVAKHKSGNYAAAVKDYLSLITKGEVSDDLQVDLGLAYQGLSEKELAVQAYKMALSINPNNSEAKKLLNDLQTVNVSVYIQKGLKEYDAKRYQSAITQFSLAVKSDPVNCDAYYYRGLVYDALKIYYRAISDYKKAVGLCSDYDMAYYSLAVDYDVLKNSPQAAFYYRKFLKLSGTKSDEFTVYAKKRVKEIK
jgi:tetratricopeptide (TPR) repeat protein